MLPGIQKFVRIETLILLLGKQDTRKVYVSGVDDIQMLAKILKENIFFVSFRRT